MYTVLACLMLLNGIYYITAEYFSVLASYDRVNAYAYHSISELGIPTTSERNFTSRYKLMNSALILSGLIFFPTYIYCMNFRLYEIERLMCYITLLLLSLGVVFLGIFHGETPDKADIHTVSATVVFISGNVLSLLTGIFAVGFNVFYNVTCILLGGVGLISTAITFFLIYKGLSIYALAERLTVYPIIFFEIITAVNLLV